MPHDLVVRAVEGLHRGPAAAPHLPGAVVGLAIPVFGFATASSLHVLGSPWLIASIAVTAIAAFVLALLVLPAQAGRRGKRAPRCASPRPSNWSASPSSSSTWRPRTRN